METVLAILYSLVGYWAVNRTIYAHYVMVGEDTEIHSGNHRDYGGG